MKRSGDRFLVTHTGSLPRPDYLLGLVTAAGREHAVPDERTARTRQAVAEIVHKQAEHGVSVVNDGEMGREGHPSYVRERLTGFDGEREASVDYSDLADFPAFLATTLGSLSENVRDVTAPPACTGPIAVRDEKQIVDEIANLRTATADVPTEDVFLTAASPGFVALWFADRYYRSREEYLFAIAEAMRHEYEAVAAAGLVLQIDCPDLAMGRHIQFPDATLDEFRRQARLNVEALNHATQAIDPEQMRMHLCWGNYEGPHHRDVALADVIDIVLEARPNAISLEASNPRHDHEWELFEDTKLPDSKVLLPGVVDTTTNYVEHPRLVAQRLVRYARLVGKENVIASTDCGFGTAAGLSTVDPDICWAKFDAMAQGARLADEAMSRLPRIRRV